MVELFFLLLYSLLLLYCYSTLFLVYLCMIWRGVEGERYSDSDSLTIPTDLCSPPSLPWLCSPQAKTLEELSEIYASAAEAQEVAAASSDPVLARERLQSVLQDIAGAAALPIIAGEKSLLSSCFLGSVPACSHRQPRVPLVL